MKLNDTRGFGLPEVLVAASILTIAILTAAFSIYNLQDLGELSKEKLTAVADANRVLEAMRDATDTSLNNLRNTDWSAWTTTNVMNTKGPNEVQLNGETLTAVIGAGNPAQVTLTLTWNHRQRAYQYVVVTLMTDRNG